jgi:hypothetical protein
VTPDASSLAVVGHQDHRRALKLAAPAQEAEEALDLAVGVLEPSEVLAVAGAPHVTGLVGGEQLEHEQVGILLVHHALGLGAQRGIEPLRPLHRGDRPGVVRKRVEQVRYADEPPTPAGAVEHVEYRLPTHTRARSEVGAHAVLGRRGPREHGGEAHQGAGRIGGLDAQVLGALSAQPIDRWGGRLS